MFFIVSAALPKSAYPDDTKEKIWIGTVTIEETGMAFLDRDESRENLIDTHFLNHTLSDRVTLLVRGKEGDLEILNVVRRYAEKYQEKKVLEHDHQLCDDGEIVRPGNSNHFDKSISKSIYRGERRSTLHPRFNSDPGLNNRVRLIGMSESKCLIHVSSTALVASQLREKSEIRWACEGRNQIDEVVAETCSPDEEPSSHLSGQGTNHRKFTSYNPPGQKILAGMFEGTIANDTLTGSQLIYEQQPTSIEGMAVKCIGTWDLRRVEQKTPCITYIQMVEGDVKINGNNVEEGPYSGDLSGAKISLGPKSRAKINMGDTIIFLGENTEITLVDPCAQKGSNIEFDARLMRGTIYAIISGLTGNGSAFNVTASNAHAGVRGIPIAMYGKNNPDGRGYALSGPSEPIWKNLFPEKEIQSEAPDFSEDEIKYNAAVAVMIENLPGKPLFIKSVIGPNEITDSTGETSIINTGETFTKKWKQAETKSDIKEVIVRGTYSPDDETS